MKLEENMYVRTKYGRIAKIEYIEDNTAFCDNWLWQSYEDHIDFINLKDEEDIEDIIKASFNIIDLIEENDYIRIITSSKFDYVYSSYGKLVIRDDIDISNYSNKFVAEIITHEQMEQMSYKVGE